MAQNILLQIERRKGKKKHPIQIESTKRRNNNVRIHERRIQTKNSNKTEWKGQKNKKKMQIKSTQRTEEEKKKRSIHTSHARHRWLSLKLNIHLYILFHGMKSCTNKCIARIHFDAHTYFRNGRIVLHVVRTTNNEFKLKYIFSLLHWENTHTHSNKVCINFCAQPRHAK